MLAPCWGLRDDETQQVLIYTVNSPGTNLELAYEIVTIYNTSSNYQYVF